MTPTAALAILATVAALYLWVRVVTFVVDRFLEATR